MLSLLSGLIVQYCMLKNLPVGGTVNNENILDSRFHGNDMLCSKRFLGVIPAKAGIQFCCVAEHSDMEGHALSWPHINLCD